MPSISGQSVLILGGSSGIGFAVAKLCLAQDARVSIASSSEAKVNDAIQRLKSSDHAAKSDPVGYVIDLSSEDVETELEGLLSRVTKQGAEPLDHIVNTANKPEMRSLADMDLPFLLKSAHMTVFVPLLLAKVGAKFLREGYPSSMIFTSGQVAEKPYPGQPALTATATAVYGLTKSLACDLAPRRVNCVSPGSTRTELWGDYHEIMAKMAAEKSLLGKAGSPEEVAEAYVYLMRNTDATGSIVSSNGGSVLR